jgi:hypothetical protein
LSEWLKRKNLFRRKSRGGVSRQLICASSRSWVVWASLVDKSSARLVLAVAVGDGFVALGFGVGQIPDCVWVKSACVLAKVFLVLASSVCACSFWLRSSVALGNQCGDFVTNLKNVQRAPRRAPRQWPKSN